MCLSFYLCLQLFFALVILFPFYIMFVTSFKTQTALLINPLDLSIDFSKDIFEIFKSYFVIFKTYDFGRYILTSSYVSIGTVLITLLFAIPAAYAVARLNFFGKTFLINVNTNNLHVSSHSIGYSFIHCF